MRRLAVLVAVITVALVLPSSGALAKKGNKPATSYDVTMTFGSNGGLATTCSGTDIEMNGSLNNVLSAAGVDLEMMIPIDWWRDYDATWWRDSTPEVGWGTEGTSFVGCHGLSRSSTEIPDPFDGALWLTFGKDTSGNDTVIFQWRFDYYWQFGEPVPRGKKDHYPQEVLEIFELTSDELVWEADGTVSGPFSVTLFTKTASGITHFWDPMVDPEGELIEPILTFDLTVTPR